MKIKKPKHCVTVMRGDGPMYSFTTNLMKLSQLENLRDKIDTMVEQQTGSILVRSIPQNNQGGESC